MQPIGIMRSSDGGAELLYNNLKLFLGGLACEKFSVVRTGSFILNTQPSAGMSAI